MALALIIGLNFIKDMSEILKQLLTGKDNQTQDIARWSWILCLITVIALAGYEAVRSTISIREVAEAFGIIAGAHGAAVMMKKDSEPSGDSK
jgi:hypothetical protein